MGPHDSDIMVTESLNCKNWKAWSYEMESLLDDKDLLDNIKAAPVQQQQQQQQNFKERQDADDDSGRGGEWKRKDEMAKMLLLINCGADAKAALDGKETAFEMWSAVKTLCQAEKARQAFAALQEAITCRQARSEAAADHIARMQRLFTRIEDGGMGFSEVQRVGILLSSLNANFEDTRRKCALADPAKLRWEDVANQLILDDELVDDVVDEEVVDDVVNLIDF